MKYYKMSIKESVKYNLDFVNMFIENRREQIKSEEYHAFKDALSQYWQNMTDHYSIVSGKNYGILMNALFISDDYRMISQAETEERISLDR